MANASQLGFHALKLVGFSATSRKPATTSNQATAEGLVNRIDLLAASSGASRVDRRQERLNRVEDFYAHLSRCNLNAALKHFAEDAVLKPGHEDSFIHGKTAIHRLYQMERSFKGTYTLKTLRSFPIPPDIRSPWSGLVVAQGVFKPKGARQSNEIPFTDGWAFNHKNMIAYLQSQPMDIPPVK